MRRGQELQVLGRESLHGRSPALDMPAQQIVRLHPGQDAAHNHTGQDRSAARGL
jgi:hypothetical protein